VSWDETAAANGTGITSSSTSPQLWYTASTLSSKVFRILGYVESTQAIAGTWATSPSRVQLFGPGVKRPGEILQTVQMTTGSNTSTSSTTFVSTVVTLAITPTSAANPVMITSVGTLDSSRNVTNTTNADLGLFRSVTQIGATLGTAINENGAASTVQISAPVTRRYLDMPATASSVTYAENIRSTQAGAVNYPTQGGSMILEEIQG
jgi:hypothetical protein